VTDHCKTGMQTYCDSITVQIEHNFPLQEVLNASEVQPMWILAAVEVCRDFCECLLVFVEPRKEEKKFTCVTLCLNIPFVLISFMFIYDWVQD